MLESSLPGRSSENTFNSVSRDCDGGQRGNRTPDTRIFNGVLQNFLTIFNRLNFKNSSVLQNVLHHLIFFSLGTRPTTERHRVASRLKAFVEFLVMFTLYFPE